MMRKNRRRRPEASAVSNWTEEHAAMLEDCEKRESRMSDWEQKFIDSLGHQITHDRPVSQKQIEVLDRIWEKVTS